MLSYLLRRVLLMSITVLAISVMAFIIIQLPPGDYLSTLIHNLQARGVPDLVIQRIIEFLISIPTIPLWMALSAALPPRWTPIQVYFGITIILSVIGWSGLARVVRGRLLELREEDSSPPPASARPASRRLSPATCCRPS